MPRQGCLNISGGYYHVIGRGMERRYIFSSVEDKMDFLASLGIVLDKTKPTVTVSPLQACPIITIYLFW